jgi:hypothetical protein
MSHLSRRTKRNIATFNKIKYSPSRVGYAVTHVTGVEQLVNAYLEVKGEMNDTFTEASGPVVGEPVPGEANS